MTWFYLAMLVLAAGAVGAHSVLAYVAGERACAKWAVASAVLVAYWVIRLGVS